MIENKNKLLKLLGVGFGIAVTVGGTIGTGILRKPGIVAAQLQDPILIFSVWLAVGLYAYLGVLCVLELGISLPKAGAWYVYAKKAFGSYIGFVTGITSWLGTIASLGFGAYTMAEYMALLLPYIGNHLKLVAALLLILLTAFHALGTQAGGKSQEILAMIKAIGLLLFVFVCFYYGGSIQPSTLEATQSKVLVPGLMVGLITSLQAIFYTFDGWHTAAYFSEENTNPSENLPKAMISGVLSIIFIYLLVNAAILYVLPMELLANSKLAAADAIHYIFGERAGKIVTLFLLLSILGIVNVQVMFAPRVIYSMSRDNLFFKFAEKVNKSGTPLLALILTVILSIVLIFMGKDTSGLLSDIATFFFVLSYVSGFAALLQLRKKFPDLPRPYKVKLYPYLPWFLLVISVLFLIGAVFSDPSSSKYAVGFLLLSYPLYLGIKHINKPI